MTAAAALPLAGRDVTLAPSPATDYTCPRCGAMGTRPTCRTDCPRRISVIAAQLDLDIYGSATFREQLLNVDNAAYSRIVVDLSGTRYMDATGLGVLVGALKRARAMGGSLVIAAPREQALRMFRITGLTKVLRISATVDDAMALLAGDPS